MVGLHQSSFMHFSCLFKEPEPRRNEQLFLPLCDEEAAEALGAATADKAVAVRREILPLLHPPSFEPLRWTS